MKTKLIAGLLLAGSTLFAAPRFAIGVGFGPRAYGYGYYAAPPVVVAPAPVVVAPPPVAYVPPAPGIGFTWTPGYWYGVGPHRVWHGGYWRR
jgi:hypothetical protein